MTKHLQYFQDMMESNSALFDEFQKIHEMYAGDAKKFQKEFNEIGEKVLAVVRKYENMLCSHSEGSGYGKFSSNLSDKFRTAVRGKFPKIDFVGMK